MYLPFILHFYNLPALKRLHTTSDIYPTRTPKTDVAAQPAHRGFELMLINGTTFGRKLGFGTLPEGTLICGLQELLIEPLIELLIFGLVDACSTLLILSCLVFNFVSNRPEQTLVGPTYSSLSSGYKSVIG